MLLVDSSIWIDHLRASDPVLADHLAGEDVLCHRMIIGEVAMGSIRSRAPVLAELTKLPTAGEARHDEVMGLVEREHLFSRGLSWIDAHLLASTLITPDARLWTRDRRLEEAAERLGVAARPVN